MSYPDGEQLMLSGLQHFAFCRRQWALIHIEQLWKENVRTVDGQLFHTKAHDATQRELRGTTLILRDLSIFSHTLGLSGKCDVVEFHRSPDGVSLQGEDGLWSPFPIEYKRGLPKEHNADQLQLCAQAMCLEEMLCCSIPQGALFYGENRRRTPVSFDGTLRQQVTELTREMHLLYRKGYTPKATPSKGCNACSLKEACLPRLGRTMSAVSYVKAHLQEEDPT